jgi:hypothetical protein
LPTSLPIGEALALDAYRGFSESLVIIHAERHTLVVAKIELTKVTLQMLL